MGTNVHLTPALEKFAREAVESGQYNNVSEVVRQALRMLQEANQQRDAFEAMLHAAVAEADREGWIPAEEAVADVRAMLAERRAAKP